MIKNFNVSLYFTRNPNVPVNGQPNETTLQMAIRNNHMKVVKVMLTIIAEKLLTADRDDKIVLLSSISK